MLFRICITAVAATAFLALSAHHAQAQSNATLYGNLDVGVDHYSRQAGNTAGTIYASNSGLSNKASASRVSPSLSSQSYLGLRVTEDLGQGFGARAILEGSMAADNGTLGQDGRMWGRQAYVALSTPFGELRAGRQGTPMLTAFYLSSVERLGSTDLMGSGLVVNNTQVYQDNMLSYIYKPGPWIMQLSYSPNAGIASKVSAARSSNSPTESTGQIVAGATSGTESVDGRGRSTEAMLAYATADLKLMAVLHHDKLGVPLGQYSSTTGTTTTLFNMDSYTAFMLGAKYVVPGLGSTIGANYHLGRFRESGNLDPKVSTMSLGARHSFGALTVGAEAALSKFTNFTRGKDTSLMLALDYDLSKRTVLYSRVGYVKDDRGDLTGSTLIPAAQIAGGPAVLLVPLGASELPVFSGAGSSLDARTSIFSVGIRHAF